MNKKDWILGTYAGVDAAAKNYIAMEFNRYVQITNWKDEDLSLSKFKSRIRSTEQVEKNIATKKHKVHLHEQKWNTILRLMN